jgi:hypothetical protein
MAYGLEVYNQYGSVVYSSADVTWNQVDYFTRGPWVTGQLATVNTYPVIINKEVLVLQLLIDAPPTNRRAIAHTIHYNNTSTNNYGPASLSPGQVYVSGGSENALILVLMR